jgi:5'-phosphate synthase pdxT subunit
VGVLALQGNFAAHRRRLEELGAEAREVRNPEELAGLDALVIPGGESTTLLKFLESGPMERALCDFAASGRPVFGTCAGAILLAATVTGPPQKSLGAIDIDIERNGYGRQVDSFITAGTCPAVGANPVELVFIRAPIIRRVGPAVHVLLELDGHPVLVQQGPLLAATFHPEQSTDPRIHRYFLDQISPGT